MDKGNGKDRTATRRGFLKSVGGATALSAIGITVIEAEASDLPQVEENDPTAVALKYAHDASTIADADRPQKDRYCFNCSLYAGSEDDEWAACSIFPGKSVAGRGWCAVWAQKQG